MIISHRLEFAFFRIPKTGSTTTELLLRMTGLFDENDLCSGIPRYGIRSFTVPEFVRPVLLRKERGMSKKEDWPIGSMHTTPTEAVDQGLITEAQLNAYTCYATMRDPLDRAISAFAHHVRIPALIHQQGVLRKYLETEGSINNILTVPQVDYFMYNGNQVCTPLDFSDFQASVRTMIDTLLQHPNAGPGINFPVMPNFNKTWGKDKTANKETMINSDPEIRTELLGRFPDDIALYEATYADRTV